MLTRSSLVATIVLALAAAPVAAEEVQTRLTGYEEVPAISTEGSGVFRAHISPDDSTITWELSYADLEGDVLQAHIHFGQHSVNGGIVVFLCTNLGNGPAGTQTCPAPPATISGTVTSAGVVGGASTQLITPGELDEVIRAIRAGAAYVNVHSSVAPGGEIRGQLRSSSRP
ncbi:MAG TPA: CHRD domain-containing protein [Candidatus Tectomicrobia bacterium]|nr:CHRD domain-containing protein [Candidatus Tectomicrobia bacterium]